ncbi:hypothetical protein SAMN05421846_103147 [Chryseobacterium taeanense]|uniref:DUF5977 domain-containing protein n=1 Tax=Chryseobacterium taeanense TaxID=311334 RepID=A0A1G8GX54_9FLAO|nr:DUF5977 domain-containing protein [Chryseobacterium taeanense]SDH98964.1 hypothetical protein SAMN05421846_103147 [Chryseobacterium taeanense]
MKNIFKKVHFIVFLLLFINIFGQSAGPNPNKVIPISVPPSPTASSLGQYGDVPVNNYTGVPNIGLNLYTVKSGNISFPISLGYHASGIKVTQEAGWVGLGWSLDAGGIITRSVVGLDDLGDAYGYPKERDIPTTPTGHIDGSTGYTGFDLNYDYNSVASDYRDGQPDNFFFNFLGNSGKMVLDKTTGAQTTISGIPLKLNRSKFIFDKSTKKWKVINEKGWEFLFNTIEETESYTPETITQTGGTIPNSLLMTISRMDTLTFNAPKKSISSWYLDKITTPEGDEVSFEYDIDINRNTIGQVIRGELESEQYNNTEELEGFFFGYLSDGKHNHIISANMQGNSEVYLKKIIFNDGYIVFSTTERDDLRVRYSQYSQPYLKARKLSKMEVFDNSHHLIKKVILDYGYFNENTNDAFGDKKERYLRLKLKSVTESFYDKATQGFKNLPSHIFTYNTQPLPSKTSASMDYYGYYNGADNENVPAFNDLSKSMYNYNNQLFNSPYVVTTSSFAGFGNDNGGKQKFLIPEQIMNGSYYRSNDYPFLTGANRRVNPNYNQSGVLKEIKYPTGGKTVFTYETNDYDTASYDSQAYSYKDHYYFSYDDSMDPNGYDIQEFTITGTTLIKIHCNIRSYSSVISNANIQNMSAVLMDSSGQEIISFKPNQSGQFNFNTFVSFMLAPGTYRLKAANNINSDELEVALRLYYTERIPERTQLGAGLRIKKIESYGDSGNSNIITSYNYKSTDYSYGQPMNKMRNFYKEFDGEGLIAGYQLQGLDWNNGGSKILIRSSDPSTQLSSSAQGSFIGYRKVEVSKEDFNGNKLGKSIYHYENLPDTEYPYYFPGIPSKVSNNNGNLLKQEDFNSNNQLIKLIENTYDQDPSVKKVAKGGYFKTSSYKTQADTNYPYYFGGYTINAEWWRLKNSKETIYSSSGSSPVMTETSYSYDNPLHFQPTKIKVTFSDGNIKETNTYYAHEKGNQLMINRNMIGIPLENISTKKIGDSSKILSKNEIVFPASLPNSQSGNLILPLSDLSYNLQSNLMSNEVTYDLYDVKGNISQYTVKGNTPITLIWGYNKTKLIAKLENAKLTDIPQSLIDDIVNASDNDAQQSNDASESALIISLDNFRKNSSLSSYPITTYTYDPLIGLTSVSNPAGMREAYIYNFANGLKEIRENSKTGNIFKEYKYNYDSDSYSNLIFKNTLKSQSFIKNDCTSGMVSTSSYTYTVTEGQYTSNISQADADQQAQDDINANGQNMANTNGTCYYPYCEFNAQSSSSYVMVQYAPFQKVNNVVNAELHFMVTSNQGLNWSGGVLLGYIPSLCWPTATFTKTSGNWQVTIYQGSGQTLLRWTGSGNPSTGTPYNITFNYNVN